jgi:hypothetical protein
MNNVTNEYKAKPIIRNDLEADPSELQNLSSKPEVAMERESREALTEKLTLDFDHLGSLCHLIDSNLV